MPPPDNPRGKFRGVLRRLTGTVRRQLGASIESRKRAILTVLSLGLLLLGLFFSYAPPLLTPYGFSRAVYDRHGSLLRLTLSPDQKYRLYLPLGNISPTFREAVLLQEDQRFYQHHGIDPASVLRAFWQTYFTAARRNGASTLSMQLARLRFHIDSHHLPGKIWQMMRAVQLEMHYSKPEILEAYLNLAPYGRNIEGIGAASRIYFGRDAGALTLPEALSLAVVPQSPTQRMPGKAVLMGAPLMKARDQLFTRWVAKHPESADQRFLLGLPLETQRIEQLPFEAPQFTLAMLKGNAAGEIRSTLDLPLQHLLESILAGYVADRRSIGVENASALLIDAPSMQVLASIGSADFRDATIHGQVDGTRARRSPGSALKPFIYALAFQQGLIHPASLLKDAPVSFGSYNPENFDRDFNGPISAADALRKSRNIPAISLASALDRPSFYDFLRQAGIPGLKDADSYGLSLVLGGAEVSMRDLARLYAMLFNGGRLRPLTALLDRPSAPGTRLLSPEASFMALDILKTTVRPYAEGSGPEAYWKTGTSNGFHDAWTAGVFGHYVLVVWVGNFSGKSNPSFVGIRTAAPLFFELADAVAKEVPVRDEVAAQPAALNLKRIATCAVTGDIADDLCPTRSASWFIPGVSPIARKSIYRRILIDRQTGERACRFEAGRTEYRMVEFWPSDLRAVLANAGIHKPSPPSSGPGCSAEGDASGSAPKITSPPKGVQYRITEKDGAPESLAFSATVDADVTALYWFVGNAYAGRSDGRTPFLWTPKPGHFDIRAVDDLGRADSMKLDVMGGP